jgi:hypothetical protein
MSDNMQMKRDDEDEMTPGRLMIPPDCNDLIKPAILAPTRLPGPEDFGSVTTVVEGPKVTQSCADCGAVLLQFYSPPGMYLPALAHPYIMCCGKLRRIGP